MSFFYVNRQLSKQTLYGIFIFILLSITSCSERQNNEHKEVEKNLVSFNKDIRPILNKNCTGCHGGVTKQGGISYIYREEALGRGNSGRLNVVPGNAKASELYQRITSKDPARRMPYQKPTLNQSDIDLLATWINQGANWEEHWAFVKPTKTALPETNGWGENPIDNFTWQKMQEQGLSPAIPATAEQWLRRVSLDLIGIQPSIEELETFQASLKTNNWQQVYTKEVDRLLAKPQYGERWTSPWLDIARYADSKGYEKDNHWDVWLYRDWLINAINDDLPYDQFIIKQLAGDLLPDPTFDDYIATIFHRLTQENDEGGTDDEEFRTYAAMDRSATTWSALNGITMHCVQCHDHPYDPIPKKNYYESLAFFNTTQDADKDNSAPVLHFVQNKEKNQALFKQQQNKTRYEKELVAFGTELTTKPDWQKLAITEAEANFKSAAVSNFEYKEKVWMNLSGFDRAQIKWCYDKAQAKENKVAEPTKPLAEIKDDYCEKRYLWSTRWVYDGFIKAQEWRDKNNKNEEPSVQLALSNGQFHDASIELPARSDYIFSTEQFTQSQKVSAFKFTIDALDKEKATHTPQDGFSIDRLKIEIVKADGSITPVSISHFVPSHLQGIEQIAATKNKYLDKKFPLTSNWYNGLVTHRIFKPIDVVAVLDEPLNIAATETLRISALQLQINQPRIGKPYYLRGFTVSWTDTLSQKSSSFLPQLESYQQVLVDIASFKGKRAPIMREQLSHERRKLREFERGNLTVKMLGDIHANTPDILPEMQKKPEPANRLDFAKWFFNGDQPLTARVAVNRYWHQLFGRGLAPTLEDFGGAGESPSHLALLDWLAIHYQEDLNWKTKPLLKMIVLSATYMQSAQTNVQAIENDPHNVWLARGPRQRLTAEMVRDQALQASGLLSAKAGGKPVMPPQPDGVWQVVYNNHKWINAKGEDRYRRAVYTYMKRSSPYPSFQTFDDVGHVVSTVRRSPTNTPLQALITLNDPVYFEAAQALGKLMLNRSKQGGFEQAINTGLKRIVLRSADNNELAQFKDAFESAVSINQAQEESELMAWTDIATAMLNMHASMVR
jgi:hypothetical protein